MEEVPPGCTGAEVKPEPHLRPGGAGDALERNPAASLSSAYLPHVCDWMTALPHSGRKSFFIIKRRFVFLWGCIHRPKYPSKNKHFLSQRPNLLIVYLLDLPSPQH